MNEDVKVVQVVAFDNGRCIGKNNQLAWHIPEDLKHFKVLTLNGVIVMGRKTFESIGGLLPNRIHHVVTRDVCWRATGVNVSHDIKEAIAKAKKEAKQHQKSAIFIIGGGEIYHQSLALTDILEITHVNLNVLGDAYYPKFDDEFQQVWRSDMMIEPKKSIEFYFARYQRVRR